MTETSYVNFSGKNHKYVNNNEKEKLLLFLNESYF